MKKSRQKMKKTRKFWKKSKKTEKSQKFVQKLILLKKKPAGSACAFDETRIYDQKWYFIEIFMILSKFIEFSGFFYKILNFLYTDRILITFDDKNVNTFNPKTVSILIENAYY
jgi:hypothetical protein